MNYTLSTRDLRSTTRYGQCANENIVAGIPVARLKVTATPKALSLFTRSVKCILWVSRRPELMATDIDNDIPSRSAVIRAVPVSRVCALPRDHENHMAVYEEYCLIILVSQSRMKFGRKIYTRVEISSPFHAWRNARKDRFDKSFLRLI